MCLFRRSSSSVHSTSALFSKIINASLVNTKINAIDEAKNAWALACPTESIPEKPHLQRQWDEPICKKMQQDLIDFTLSLSDKARLIVSGTRESGFWLQALPSVNLGTLLDNITFSQHNS